jgi:hypothetical protein
MTAIPGSNKPFHIQFVESTYKMIKQNHKLVWSKLEECKYNGGLKTGENT